uniref:Uncharacterized protein n=1 Tax=Ciona intestinalis TaxID=7719 RepID=H2XV77_CIOIN
MEESPLLGPYLRGFAGILQMRCIVACAPVLLYSCINCLASSSSFNASVGFPFFVSVAAEIHDFMG